MLRESYQAECDCCGAKRTFFAATLTEAEHVMRRHFGWYTMKIEYADGETKERTFCSGPCLDDFLERQQDKQPPSSDDEGEAWKN